MLFARRLELVDAATCQRHTRDRGEAVGASAVRDRTVIIAAVHSDVTGELRELAIREQGFLPVHLQFDGPSAIAKFDCRDRYTDRKF